MQSMFSDQHKIKLEINNKKISAKLPNSCKLKDTPLNNPRIKEEIGKESCKCCKEKENTTYQNLWDAANTVFRLL